MNRLFWIKWRNIIAGIYAIYRLPGEKKKPSNLRRNCGSTYISWGLISSLRHSSPWKEHIYLEYMKSVTNYLLRLSKIWRIMVG